MMGCFPCFTSGVKKEIVSLEHTVSWPADQNFRDGMKSLVESMSFKSGIQ